MKSIRLRLGLAAFGICGLMGIDAWAAGGAAPGTAQRGADLYRLHCAACHGVDAAGSGLMTPQLRHVPPDLRQLSAKNGGMFPRARVRRIIEGRDVPSHGDRDMPVWGDAFSRIDPASSESSDVRISAIIDYLESTQVRASH